MDDHLPRPGRGMPAQRTIRWARCPNSLRAAHPGTAVPIPAYSPTQVVDYLRSCLDEVADTTDEFTAEHLETVLHRARTLVRRRRRRDLAAMTTFLVAAAVAGFLLGVAL